MPEKVHDVELIFIENTSGRDYTVECVSRRGQSVRLNYTQVEGIELAARAPLEIKNSFLQLADGQPKTWNIRFDHPLSLSIQFVGKIIIESF